MATATTTAKTKFRYLSAWFCPFAHRATLALEHHAGRVDYEWVEVRTRQAVAESFFSRHSRFLSLSPRLW